MLTHSLSSLGGVEIDGVDLSRPLPAEPSAKLAALFDEHGLLLLRNQQLTKAQLLAATEPFGGPDIPPAVDGGDPEAPGLSVISTRGATGDLAPDDPQGLIGDIDWHTDQAYVVMPNRGKLLYAVEVPEIGGKTGFLDGQLTYEALTEELKEQIDELHVIQSWRHAQVTIARNRKYRVKGDTVLAEDRFPDVAYRLVHKHPRTGRRILNLPPFWAAGIVEMPGEMGRQLLDRLIAHIRQPQFAYWHSYRPGDVVAWDNWRFLHAASGTPGRYRRTIWSVVIRGDIDFGRLLEQRATEMS